MHVREPFDHIRPQISYFLNELSIHIDESRFADASLRLRDKPLHLLNLLQEFLLVALFGLQISDLLKQLSHILLVLSEQALNIVPHLGLTFLTRLITLN